jgi:hypothetical protein
MWIAVAACGAPATKPVPPPPLPVAHGPERFVFRQRHVGERSAHRTTFALTLDGSNATMIETEERAPDFVTWTTVSTRTYRGTRNGSELALATDDMQPLALHCEHRGMAGAGPGDDCTAMRDRKLDALVCNAPGQVGGDADDFLMFAAPPGLEWLEATCGSGLRQVR